MDFSVTVDTGRLVAFAQALVQTPGLSGAEEAVGQRVAAEMRALGFDSVAVDANGSVVGVVEGARPGPTLLYDAHTDTVGIAPAVPWSRDPFGAQVENGALYGRGSVDMKGALAGMVHAAAGLERARLRGRVVVSASTLEEVLEGVALRDVMAATAPDFVVIGESTDLNVVRAGRGRAELHLTTVGVPAHSSSPQLGRNAALAMLRVVAEIEQLPLPADPLIGPAVLALTDIISQPHPGNSMIPSLCRVTYDRRLLPGESEEGVLRPIAALPAAQDAGFQVAVGDGSYRAYTGRELTAHKFFPAWAFPAEHAFVQGALAGLGAIGLNPQLGAYRFCTNAAYSAGIAGVPTVGFGPGTEAGAHVVDECVYVDDLIAAARGYQAIAYAMLGG